MHTKTLLLAVTLASCWANSDVLPQDKAPAILHTPVCPSPYTHRGNECFFVSEDENDLLNWDEARDRCLRMGGDLAQPQDMVDFVKYITESYPNNKPTIWIGATDRAVEQDWYWLSGEPVPPALWKSSPFNQPSGDGDCMEIHTGWTRFYMNDHACHAKGYFACERAILPTKVTINQCVGDGEDNSILWDKVDSAETAIIMTVNDGNNNVRGAIEMELQFLKENITDANSKLEEELKIVKAKLDQILNKSECPDGFFSLTGSSKCFKIFKDKTRSWFESIDKCKEEKLVLAHPSDSVALRSYLVQTYGPYSVTWVNAKGDGSNIIWQDNGETFPKDNPLWQRYNPHVSDKNCVRLMARDYWLDDQPTKPYATETCTRNEYLYALCSSTMVSENKNLEKKIETMYDNLKELIQKPKCSDADGFFRLTGSSKCFKIFKDKTRDWYESKDKCNEEDLVLAHPSDSIALRRYLVQTYGSPSPTWVNANEDGSNIIWQDNGETFPKDSPLWWPGNPQFTDIRCVRLLAEDYWLDRRPTKPYATEHCTKNDSLYALCSMK